MEDREQRGGDQHSGIQAAAYSRASSSSNGASSRAIRRREAAQSLQDYNRTMREVQMQITKNKCYERELSPAAQDPTNFEVRPLNENINYNQSPAAKRARQDGSLDPSQTHFNRTFNRKLKMRDTFTKIFPAYKHAEPTCYINSVTHHQHYYPKKDDVGKKMQEIDRSYTHKVDFIKEYTESMLKIQNMRRT
uniref:Uncharacterized protein n=1 Tax=Favella ehrenbergii TaxID=182087 RepID=A0A7S3HYA9_9SPIT|mmetsp:Transcript_17796/g.22408  ORF Transcript_17796/g.22408 Transcript_17796/m.22408 type:complete len:192 (+) Transcript_17796:174-749(+)